MNVAHLWYDESVVARAARRLLAPASFLWREGMALRSTLYDRGWRKSEAPPIPALSVGNLSVGGTGKTPVAAYLAAALQMRGARPALLMRGYGDDEPKVHAFLNPEIPVIVGADRRASARDAERRGCDVLVLDDAFQHRRVRRAVDIVLIAAEQWSDKIRTLPGGPYREGVSALARASMILITRKAASLEDAQLVRSSVQRLTSHPVGIVSLQLGNVIRVSSPAEEQRNSRITEILPLSALRARRVLAIAGIGDPHSFARQLTARGANVVLVSYADHHAFDAAETQSLARRAEAMDFVVCTLKDAVKLAPLWPRAVPSLWYVSQRIDLEEGGAQLEIELRRLLDARHAVPTPTAG
ncbi:MAG: tetraacyldisaccharide 4'-kinase [Gemmatimonadaceae bacterium]